MAKVKMSVRMIIETQIEVDVQDYESNNPKHVTQAVKKELNETPEDIFDIFSGRGGVLKVFVKQI